jgi:hypothetical protein
MTAAATTNTAREASLEKALHEIASHDLFGLRDPYRGILQGIVDAAKHALAKEAMPVEPYSNEALTDICKRLLDDWCLTPEQIALLAQNIAGECEAILENRAEASWEDRSAPDDSSYRRDMINAGRGHLLR